MFELSRPELDQDFPLHQSQIASLWKWNIEQILKCVHLHKTDYLNLHITLTILRVNTQRELNGAYQIEPRRLLSQVPYPWILQWCLAGNEMVLGDQSWQHFDWQLGHLDDPMAKANKILQSINIIKGSNK